MLDGIGFGGSAFASQVVFRRSVREVAPGEGGSSCHAGSDVVRGFASDQARVERRGARKKNLRGANGASFTRSRAGIEADRSAR